MKRPDITLRIGEVSLELGPRRTVRTLGYNGDVPGPLIRARQGRPFTVEVWNDSRETDIVHWHGLHIGPDVDGAFEEGTPAVAPGAHRQYTFVPDPPGTRWYHSHTTAGHDLKKSTYSGQFGVFIVESGGERGGYDREEVLVLHDWEARFDAMGEVEYRTFSINGKMLGAAPPIRVNELDRVLFRFVNASATLHHRLALPGHAFHVVALDGNPVPTPTTVPVLDIGPGERIDAIVEMMHPGVWTLGELMADQRANGMGIVVEYAGRTGAPRWLPPPPFVWDHTRFGRAEPLPEPDGRLTLAFKPAGDGHHWAINGKTHPRIDPIVVAPGKRYRWTLDNQSADAHPIHIHRHQFEIVRVDGRPTSGIRKDVVVVPAWRQVEVDVIDTRPGPSLVHCHQQFHMDMGFMTIMHAG
ncbi:MAG TPA: multicopper oxidase family protein [Vicinamibacterales bacterium]|nr:multicopper oxidase family protein [Vicinamibacterales bacterium]